MFFLLAALIPLTFSAIKTCPKDRIFYIGLSLLSAISGAVYIFYLM